MARHEHTCDECKEELVLTCAVCLGYGWLDSVDCLSCNNSGYTHVEEGEP